MEYKFNPEDFDLEKIINFQKLKIIESDNYMTITQICKEALEFSNMIAIIGEPGYGKTSTLEHFATFNKNVIYISAEKTMTSKIFYSLLLEKIGYKNIHNSNNIYHIIDSIGYYLKQSSEKFLIIIDEAGKLTHQKLLYLHDLRNSVSKNTGIILAGPKYFEKNMKEMMEKDVEGIPELNRRIINWIELLLPSTLEKRAICIEYGITSNSLINTLSKSTNYQTLSDVYNAICVFGILAIRYLDEKK